MSLSNIVFLVAVVVIFIAYRIAVNLITKYQEKKEREREIEREMLIKKMKYLRDHPAPKNYGSC